MVRKSGSIPLVFIMKKNKINKEIRQARKELRKIYIKYTKELFDVVSKIDKALEGLEVKD